jgi:hypothetical protein
MFLECIVAVTCPYCKYCYCYTHNAMPWPSDECWWSSGTEGEAFMGRKSVGAVKGETNMNPNQSGVLSNCTLLSGVYDTILLSAHQQA